MIGIYKITNKINNKCYIGQSVDIERRWKGHISKYHNGTEVLYEAFRKYGLNNFSFEILETCKETQLDNREVYWSNYFNSLIPNGYNMVQCGSCSYGEYNQNSKYTTEEIYKIRKRIFIDNESPINVFKDYESTMGRTYFYKIVHGDFRREQGSGIELVRSLVGANSIGELNSRTQLTNNEVLSIRNRIYVEKEARLNVFQDYKTRISWDAFTKLITGETWKNVDCSMIQEIKVERKGKPKAKITKEEVGYIRYRHEVLEHSINDIFNDYNDRVTRNTIKRIIKYETWKDVKPVSTIPEA